MMNKKEIRTIAYRKLDLTIRQRGQFERLAQLLSEKNRQVNLTAITDPEEIREKHFADSLAISLLENAATLLTAETRVLDLGSGGGFPGLPIKIAYPGVHVTMLDSTKKKLSAVDDMIAALDLEGTKTLWGRAETLAHQENLRGSYDLVVSRAAMYLPALIECAVPFLQEGGCLIAYKQGENDEEISASARALTELNAKIKETIPYFISSGDRRQLVIIQKTGLTPDQYPRREGVPVKKPL